MDDQQIQDGEIVESQNATDPNQAIILTNLEDSIKSHISRIERLEGQLKEEKATLDNILLNDPTYKDHSEAVKQAAKTKAITRKEILKRPEVAKTNQKAKDLALENKSLKEELSEYLREYQRMSGANEIEGEDGEIRQIVLSAKLVKTSSKGR